MFTYKSLESSRFQTSTRFFWNVKLFKYLTFYLFNYLKKWMEGMSEKSEWKEWIEVVNGRSEWKEWMEGMYGRS